MGLDTASTNFVCAAKSMGVNFSNLLMIGRQSLFPEPGALQQLFSIHGIDVDATQFLKENKFGDRLFSLLGAQEINSLDYSSYEEATILHDMNLPIPENLRERFSVVYDGGTIEHVFNITQAFKNCMEMVKVGGHFLQVNVANNFMGHGFWQFSPELLFRVFSPENGFTTEAVMMHEVIPDGAWYAVSDPDQIHRRVELCNNTPVYILTIARRISSTAIFVKSPLQSDYSAIWERATRDRTGVPQNLGAANNMKAKRTSFRSRVRSHMPDPLIRVLQAVRDEFRHGKSKGFEESCYRLISEDDLLRGKLSTAKG